MGTSESAQNYSSDNSTDRPLRIRAPPRAGGSRLRETNEAWRTRLWRQGESGYQGRHPATVRGNFDRRLWLCRYHVVRRKRVRATDAQARRWVRSTQYRDGRESSETRRWLLAPDARPDRLRRAQKPGTRR